MLTKQAFLKKFPDFVEGAKVRSKDDENLGKVVSASDDYIVIEKGLFFPKDFTVRYDDIAGVREGIIYLNMDRAALEDWGHIDYPGWNRVENIKQTKKIVHTELKHFAIPVTGEEVEQQGQPEKKKKTA